MDAKIVKTMRSFPLIKLFNQFIESVVFLVCQKMSKVFPIHKGGYANVLTNFAPIT